MDGSLPLANDSGRSVGRMELRRLSYLSFVIDKKLQGSDKHSVRHRRSANSNSQT
jgi:hypothetical protein